MSSDALFSQDIFRQIDEINRAAQPLEAILKQFDRCQSNAEMAVRGLSENESALVRGATHFDDTQAYAATATKRLHENQDAQVALDVATQTKISQPVKAIASMQGQLDGCLAGFEAAVKQLHASDDALAVGVLAQGRAFDDTRVGVEAVVSRLREHQAAIAIAQTRMSTMADGLASVRRPDWISEIALVKACFEDARLLREALSPAPGLPPYVQSLLDSQAALESTYGSDLQAVLGWSPQDTIGPALVALRGGLVEPSFALLAGNDMGGLLTWVGERDALGGDRSLLSAPWLPAELGARPGSQARVIHVRCEVTCKWCSEPLLTSGRDQEVDGASAEVTLSVSAVPLCLTCLKRAEADLTYLERDASEPAVSEFRLIPGFAESTSEPRGRAVLHLVQRKGESEDK